MRNHPKTKVQVGVDVGKGDDTTALCWMYNRQPLAVTDLAKLQKANPAHLVDLLIPPRHDETLQERCSRIVHTIGMATGIVIGEGALLAMYEREYSQPPPKGTTLL